MGVNIDKFQWAQMFNNSKGKTSVTLLCGFLIIIASVGAFCTSAITMMVMLVFKYEKDVNVINFFSMLVLQSIVFAGIGATLLGIRRFTTDKNIEQTDEAKISN